MPRNTVYVIGAGASYEADLPVGNELKEHIAKMLYLKFEHGSFKSGDYDFYQALKHYAGNEVNDYLRECSHISTNMPLASSIDNFIDTERGNDKLALCGKMAIVKSILVAEKKSRLYLDKYQDRMLKFPSLENTWYLSFFRALTENCSVNDLHDRFRHITLVIFNYDRCIEHFLLYALVSYYRLAEADAAEIISSLKIIHPYGNVGSLAWQDRASSTNMEFGGEIHLTHLVDYAQRIRTFTEGAHSEQMQVLRYNMANTERLVFLGFAFHRLNMELLMADSSDRYENPLEIECYATAYETSKSDQESIRNSINYLYQGELNINIENTTCSQLFQDYSRSLGFA